ncbi:hypothetical protein ACIQ9P_09810 [Kitasatospora sp. NPDC094019]
MNQHPVNQNPVNRPTDLGATGDTGRTGALDVCPAAGDTGALTGETA